MTKIVKEIEIYVRVVTIYIEKIYNKNEKKRKNDDSVINMEKLKIDNVNKNNNNNRTLLVAPSFSGKIYFMLKILSRTPDRDIYVITKSPPEHYSNSSIKSKEVSDEIIPLYNTKVVF